MSLSPEMIPDSRYPEMGFSLSGGNSLVVDSFCLSSIIRTYQNSRRYFFHSSENISHINHFQKCIFLFRDQWTSRVLTVLRHVRWALFLGSELLYNNLSFGFGIPIHYFFIEINLIYYFLSSKLTKIKVQLGLSAESSEKLF